MSESHKLRIEHDEKSDVFESEYVVMFSARVDGNDTVGLPGAVDLYQCVRRADGTGEPFNHDRIILRREMIEPLARFLWAVLGKLPPGESSQE